MACHHFGDHAGGAAVTDHVDHDLIVLEHPVPVGPASDPHRGLVDDDATRAAGEDRRQDRSAWPVDCLSDGREPAPAKALGDSHISFRLHYKQPATVDGIKLLHATPEGNGPWGLIIAVPTTEAGDDPACPGEASDGARVFLPFCLAFECRTKCFEGFDLRLGEYSGRRQLVLAVTFLHQLQ